MPRIHGILYEGPFKSWSLRINFISPSDALLRPWKRQPRSDAPETCHSPTGQFHDTHGDISDLTRLNLAVPWPTAPEKDHDTSNQADTLAEECDLQELPKNEQDNVFGSLKSLLPDQIETPCPLPGSTSSDARRPIVRSIATQTDPIITEPIFDFRLETHSPVSVVPLGTPLLEEARPAMATSGKIRRPKTITKRRRDAEGRVLSYVLIPWRGRRIRVRLPPPSNESGHLPGEEDGVPSDTRSNSVADSQTSIDSGDRYDQTTAVSATGVPLATRDNLTIGPAIHVFGNEDDGHSGERTEVAVFDESEEYDESDHFVGKIVSKRRKTGGSFCSVQSDSREHRDGGQDYDYSNAKGSGGRSLAIHPRHEPMYSGAVDLLDRKPFENLAFNFTPREVLV
ncbi:hypothetical protein HJFPF1_07266 [Paramyrothecium foliicola]|nr:hypothetical protein HJFPF1_07266 [Paramyrothecium foliicola]